MAKKKKLGSRFFKAFDEKKEVVGVKGRAAGAAEAPSTTQVLPPNDRDVVVVDRYTSGEDDVEEEEGRRGSGVAGGRAFLDHISKKNDTLNINETQNSPF